MADEQIKVAVLETELKNLTNIVSNLVEKIDSLHDKIDNHYIKKEDFATLKGEVNVLKKEVDKLKNWQLKVGAIAGAVVFTFQYLPGVLKTIFESISK